jgi:hypothetical protein
LSRGKLGTRRRINIAREFPKLDTGIKLSRNRRSKRNSSSNKRFKPDIPLPPKGRKKQQKSPGKLQQGKQHLPFFSLSDFPDLAKVDKFFASGINIRALPVDLLQKVATERCVCASRPSRYVSVINDNHLVSLMNFNAAKMN